MDLSHEFDVPLSIDEAWAVLTDLERVAPCMPGAQLDEIEGDEYRGKVRVKVGPVTVEYKGAASFLERVPETHTAVLRAAGRETKGQGNAAATVTATLESAGDALTHVKVVTALDISGRVAQFGRGALADVSSKILGQFVENLERDLAAGSGVAASNAPAKSTEAEVASNGEEPTAIRRRAAPKSAAKSAEEEHAEVVGESPASQSAPHEQDSTSEGEGGIRKINSAPAEPVKLASLVSPRLVKRLVPEFVLAVVAVVLFRRFRHKSAS
jgi:hypothetical protein